MAQEIVTQPERISVKDRIVNEYKEALEKVRESYKKDGWEVDTQEIESALLPLREKTNLLNSGRITVDLTSPDCGCKWEVTDGCLIRTRECGRESCEGFPYKKSEATKAEKPKRSVPCCGEHGTPMEWGQDKRYHCKECEINDR